MAPFFNNVSLFLTATRAYSLPISFMSWLVPFVFASLSGGNLILGLFSLLGILILHLATNIFDDTVDYTREQKYILSGKKDKFDFQSGKCSCIFEGKLNLKQYYVISFVLFFVSLIFALFFIYFSGLKLLFVLIPCVFICLLYPVLGCLGLGEILVSIVFSPLIYLGVYYVMTGYFSKNVLLLSVATGLLAVAVLHNHMLLDFPYDCSNRKITLSRLLGSEKRAWLLLLIIILSSYVYLLLLVALKKFSLYYLLPILSFPQAFYLLKVMYNYVKRPSRDNFLYNFKLPQNLLTSYTILLCISIVTDKCI